MSADKNERQDSLKYQWRLYGLISRSEWATSLDKSVAYEIIDKYSKDFKNSRASLRYLERATGATRPNIIASVRRLTDLGPFGVIQKGSGTAATKYQLHFDRVQNKASGIADNTSSELCNSGTVDDTSSGIADDTSKVASGIACNTESDLQLADLKDGLIGGEGINDSAPVRGGVSASADAARTAAEEDGFEALWRAYDLRKDKASAREAFNKINPDAAKLACMIESAIAWRRAWEAKPDSKRKYLRTWITDESWDCDAPGSRKFVNPDRKASPKPKPPTPANSNQPPPKPWQWVEIVGSEVIGKSGDNELRIAMRTESGETVADSIILEHARDDLQNAGQRQFEKLRIACGVDEIEEAEELQGRRFERRVSRGSPEYRAVAAEAA